MKIDMYLGRRYTRKYLSYLFVPAGTDIAKIGLSQEIIINFYPDPSHLSQGEDVKIKDDFFKPLRTSILQQIESNGYAVISARQALGSGLIN